MSIEDELRAVWHPRLKRIVLSPEKYIELVTALSSVQRFFGHDEDTFGLVLMWQGIPCRLESPTGFCRNCGAPLEPSVCSYCKSQAEYVRVE